MSFPEEQLDSPVGYFHARIGQELHGGQWTIDRKLGWGPRSSTWMAFHNTDKLYAALKIFTRAATKDSSGGNEQKFLYLIRNMSTNSPKIRQHFYEKSPRGKHLCVALNPLTFSVETLRLSNRDEGEYFPLHMVKKILIDVLSVLGDLGDKGIIHGAILPDNLLFWSIEDKKNIDSTIARIPCHDMIQVIGNDGKEYLTLESQPMPQGVIWNDTALAFERIDIFLSNFSHARRVAESAPYRSASNFLPPEVLMGGKVNCTVDIWMLGCTAYLLATGTPLFSDAYVLSPLKVSEETLPKLEQLLTQNGKVSTQDIPMFSVFLRMCLVSDPEKRAKFKDLFKLEWIDCGIMCSCRLCTASQSKPL